MKVDGRHTRSIWLEPDGWSVGAIDQTRLPHRFETIRLTRLDDAALAATLNFVVFELGHAGAAVKPFAPGEIAAERGKSVDGAAVREHRAGLVP